MASASGKTFSASVDAFVRKSKLITEAVFKESVQRVAEDANTPIEMGGKMKVITGFLRGTMGAAVNTLPSGPKRKVGEAIPEPDDVVLAFAKATTTDVLYIGWSAAYARKINLKYGYRDAAVQKWRQTVAAVSEEAKRRIG